MRDLSILIPSRNELFLKNTIEDILIRCEADTEVIAVLDGAWASPPIPQHERVNLIYVNKAIGQRAGTNLACKLSKAKWVMKIDAHCSFDQGFDRKMLEAFEEVGDNVVVVPIMRNLHAFDWKCYHCGWKMYQGPTPKRCPQCNERHHLKRKMIWRGKPNPQSTSYCFDTEPHFQYFEDYKHRPQYIADRAERGLTETMSLQGSCFMCTREKYWEWELCDETLGNWGNQGIELSMKVRLAGGRVLCNHRTWYAHMFRTQGGDFSFPWPVSGRDVQRTKRNVRDLFWTNSWPKQIYPLSKVIEQFWPIPGWRDEDFAALRSSELEINRPGIFSATADGQIYVGSAVSLAQSIFEYKKLLPQHIFRVERFCAESDLPQVEQKFIEEHRDVLQIVPELEEEVAC